MAAIQWEPSAGTLTAGYGVPFMHIRPSSKLGSTGRLTVKLNGATLSSSDVTITADVPVVIPKPTWDALDYTVDHTLEVTLVSGADSGQVVYKVRRIPTPIGAADSNRAAIDSFREHLDAREECKVELTNIANAYGSL